jgi:Cu(I)/Ag(I) efflux system membrane fusion protein
MEMTQATSTAIKHTSFGVSGNCEMCKERIETAAKSVKGVTGAEWDMKSKVLQLDIASGMDPDNVHRAIANAGHDTDKIKADNKVYSELPECCLYRK